MFTRELELAHLLQARSHIAATTGRIALQRLLIARWQTRGIDTEQAEDSLRVMQETLRVMQARKQLIEDMLAQNDAVTSARAAVRASMARLLGRIDRVAPQQQVLSGDGSRVG